MTKRQEQYEKTRQKIWETGKALIAKKGYDQVSIADITSAAGVSPGNFYHYFKSKDAFFAALEKQPYDDLASELNALPDGTIADRLTYYIQKRFRFLGENGPNFTRQWIRHASEPRYQELYKEETKIDSDIHMIDGLLTDAVAKGELSPETPVHDLSRMIVHTLFGTTFYYCVRDGHVDLEEWGRSLAALLENTIFRS